MIIKSIHINAFGGIKNYHLKFIKGMNLIYGENEAGKSTIQNFVKIFYTQIFLPEIFLQENISKK